MHGLGIACNYHWTNDFGPLGEGVNRNKVGDGFEVVKFMCRPRHEVGSQDQGCSGEAWVTFLISLLCWHSRKVFSMPLSIPGHQTWLRAMAFMPAIPEFASLSTLGIGGLKAVGMMVHKPHMRQPCSTARSCLHVRHCFNWGSGQKWVGQPSRGRDSALAREGVLEVSLAISEADTEHRLICLLATWSISCSTYGYVLYWRNSLDSASAGDTGVYDLHSSS